ncbi:MAG: ORF6N domain-containing protein, partial [Planctomycetaceae bacterium]|nr:ORF6N domain-containing protein [Planctomycetaceae bacterium]
MKFKQVEEKIITIRGQSVILDNDVAELYGVTTKEVNQAVRNNPEKFPSGYLFELTVAEWNSLRSKILTLKKLGRGEHKKYLPKAFTEKGLYLLATI